MRIEAHGVEAEGGEWDVVCSDGHQSARGRPKGLPYISTVGQAHVDGPVLAPPDGGTRSSAGFRLGQAPPEGLEIGLQPVSRKALLKLQLQFLRC